MKQSAIRIGLLVIGWACVILGTIGIFLPLLPTTPFLLLASACFMKGSPKLNDWLMNHKTFGPILHNWHQNCAISSVVKRRANITMVLSFLLSISLVPLWWHKLLLFVMGITLLCWFNRLPVVDSVAAPVEKQ